MRSPLIKHEPRGLEAKRKTGVRNLDGKEADRIDLSRGIGEIGNSPGTQPRKALNAFILEFLAKQSVAVPRFWPAQTFVHANARARIVFTGIESTWLAKGSGDKLPGSSCTKPRLEQRLYTRGASRHAWKYLLFFDVVVSARLYLCRDYRFIARANGDTMHSRKSDKMTTCNAGVCRILINLWNILPNLFKWICRWIG